MFTMIVAESERTTVIVGMVVAVYGAVLSTFNTWKASRRDRADVRLHVSPHMSFLNDPLRQGMTFTIVTATNIGTRPVTITHVASSTLDSVTHNVLTDVRPRLPCPLTEGQYLTAFRDEALGGLESIESWYVVDSAGREHYKHMVPWHRRLLSKHRKRKAWKKRKLEE